MFISPTISLEKDTVQESFCGGAIVRKWVTPHSLTLVFDVCVHSQGRRAGLHLLWDFPGSPESSGMIRAQEREREFYVE